MECGLMHRIFFYLLISGASTLITVHQPPILITALGEDVILPCHLSSDDMVKPPILYWLDQDKADLWPPSDKFKERVDRVDENEQSLNKSILLKNVQWGDSGKYLCKLSILTSESERRRRIAGNETQLLIYDTMIFYHNSTLLSCQVNVSSHPGFLLSILHDGDKIRSVSPGCRGSGCNQSAQLYVTVSVAVSLAHGGKYECQLHLNKDLIAKMVPASILLEQDVVTVPEPWLFYGGFLLVHTVILSTITAVLLICRREV